jgi:hypothetical protein
MQMARIRTIKPELFRHEALFEAEKSSKLPLRVAFAGLFTAADRQGRFKWQPRVLKLDVLPFDEIDFGKVLDALAQHAFIVKYEIEGEFFGHIPSWFKHQHINQREAESEIPAPDSEGARTCTHVQTHGEGKGREGKGKEGEGVSVALKRDPGPVERIFEHWQEEFGKKRAALDGKRRRTIEAALKLHDEPTLRSAISGYRNSPHHMGENERRTVYDDIELFLRDATHIENGLRFARGPPAPAMSAVEQARQKLRQSVNGNGRVVSEQSGTGDGRLVQTVGLLR